MFHAPNDRRYRGPDRECASDDTYGNNGVFTFKHKGAVLSCIVSDGQSWEHVSVSLGHRTPTWAEMCFIKSVFWDPEDCVIQYHPPESQYVNHHPYCLHLWRPGRPHGAAALLIPLPPLSMV